MGTKTRTFVTFGGTVDERAGLSFGGQGVARPEQKLGQQYRGSDPILRRENDGGGVWVV